MKTGFYAIAAVCIALAMACAGCVGQSGTTAANTTGSLQADVIHLSGGDYGYPQPFTIYPRGPGSSKVTMIFDSLVEKDEKGLIPWLASNWTISDDQKEYTFTLRDNVTWQDGVPFTANDVKFTMDYEQTHVPVSGGMETGIVKSVQVIDNSTVRFVLNEPTATFLYKLYGFKIIPEHIYENVTDPTAFLAPEAVIGTGPYKLAQYNKEQGTYQFVANPGFWGPEPAIKTVEFVPVSDDLIAFEQGDIDFTSITPDTLGRFENNTNIRLVQQPAFWGYEFYFNMNKCPELKDNRIRQAFAYAIDRDELVEKIQRGAGKPGMMGILPQDHIWYNSNQTIYSHNVEKANALLDEAGWKDTDGDGIRDKNGTKLSYTLSLGSDEVRIGELVKARLAEAGIDVQVKALESKSRDANLKKGDFELIVSGFGGWGQDADYLRTRYCDTANQTSSGVAPLAKVLGYHNETLNTLAAEEISEMDDAKREMIVYRMQQVLADDVPTIPLLYTTSYDAWSKSKYDGWMNMFDHHARTQSKLSYLTREGIAAER